MTRIPKFRRYLSFVTLLATVLAVVWLAAVACSGSSNGSNGDTAIEGLPPEFQRLSEVWELLMTALEAPKAACRRSRASKKLPEAPKVTIVSEPPQGG